MVLPNAALLRNTLRSFQLFGANTGVGKTVFSTVLCKAAKRVYGGEQVTYLKPVSTGPENERDDRHINKFASDVRIKTLFQYGIPVSPHLAARQPGQEIASDQQILSECEKFVSSSHQHGKGWLFLETAGGVNSPAPSGTTQADLYTPLRVPVVLVGDSKLGGISLTISAFESLRLRGYDVETILLFRDEHFGNFSYLNEYFKEKYGIPVSAMPEPPSPAQELQVDTKSMGEYYEATSKSKVMAELLNHLDGCHQQRISKLEGMADEADRCLWYPFTQHKAVDPNNITVIDSAHGDFFQILNKDKGSSDGALLRPAFDGSASWWTQGLGHGNPKLTMAAAYAAGRYGHVLYPGMVHDPAISLAKLLLEGALNPRLARVFYSDNGSTGTEIAVKMALRAARLRYGWTADDKIEILNLRGAYHGDTMGAMDCSEPGTFNKKVEWYQGKGFWFDFPTVTYTEGKWSISMPDTMNKYVGSNKTLPSLGSLFDVEDRLKRGEHEGYKAFIEDTLKDLQAQGRKFGALMLEPVVLGAGGMMFVDPLFQRTLVDTVRQSSHLFGGRGSSASPSPDANAWTGLPVIFDEVFAGLYRLGRFTAASFLGTNPDISVHAKLLTGGLVPLCATLASEEIFECFIRDEKSDALLHGHSYTAHPVGCQVALESVKEMQKFEANGQWAWAQDDYLAEAKQDPSSSGATSGNQALTPGVWSVWSLEFIRSLSHDTAHVLGVWALGSVLAIHMRDSANLGYSSSVSKNVQEALLSESASGTQRPFSVHVRVLGNVLYVMAGQKTEEDTVRHIERMIQHAFSTSL